MSIDPMKYAVMRNESLCSPAQVRQGIWDNKITYIV